MLLRRFLTKPDRSGVARALVLSGLLAACASPVGDGQKSDVDQPLTAHALLYVTDVPPSVNCIRISVTGAWTDVFLIPTQAGKAATLSAGGLPTGEVTFLAEAFGKACTDIVPTDIAEWTGDPVKRVLRAGVTVLLDITLRRNGLAKVTFGFEFAQECSITDNSCPSSEICFRLACGDSAGGCLTRPTACSHEYNPVCGCNGATYANQCLAAAAGQSIDHPGGCECGGEANIACPTGYTCTFPLGMCSTPARTGVCTATPVACPQISKPVCGCNEKTYANECLAQAAGQSVSYEGACVPQVCGGPERLICRYGDRFCAFAEGTCNQPDRFGTCVDRPKSCPTVKYAPVCACNGQVYSNECWANSVGLSVSNRGPTCTGPQ